MVAKGKLTILVLPSSPGKSVSTLSIPFLTLPAAFFALGILLIMACAGAWRIYGFQKVEQKSYRLQMESRSAKNQIQDQESRIEYLTREILNIREKAAYVQSYLGLKPQGSSIGKIGQGGVELTLQSVALYSKSPSTEIHQPSSISTTHADPLSAQEIRQLNADLQEIVGALQGRKEKLDHTPSVSPVDPRESWISSSYGLRISPFTGKEQFHPGIDIAGAAKTPIVAPAKGTIVFVGRDGALGMTVRIRHDSVYQSTYGHLHKVSVKKGQHVERGEVIGHMGNSGRSTGNHLHYEVAKNGKNVNPFPYMMDWKNDNLAMLAE